MTIHFIISYSMFLDKTFLKKRKNRGTAESEKPLPSHRFLLCS